MNSYNILFVSFINIFLSLFILFFNYERNKSVVCLSLSLMLFSIYNMTVAIFIFGGPVWLFAILFNNFAPLQYLTPVFFYLYIRSTSRGSVPLRKNDLFHFIPFAVNFLAVIPYMLTSWSHKYSSAQSVMCNVEAYMNFDFMLFYPHEINQFVRPVQLIVYFIASLILVVKSIRKDNKEKIHKKTNPLVVAMGIMMVFIVFHFFLQIYLSLKVLNAENYGEAFENIRLFIHVISFLYLLVPLLIFFNPRFLYGVSNINELKKRSRNDKGKYSKNDVQLKIESESMKILSESIMNFIKEEKPYLKEEFSVHDICIKLNVPQHQVQYCINVVMKTNFVDLKNELRVQYAIELLSSGLVHNLTIESIGKSSGFASSSNFHSAFKKVTGRTPNQWLKENLPTSSSA